MKRVIKFRAWDIKKEVLTYRFPEGYHLDLLGNVINEDIGVVNDDWITLQFTGLTDKNGKEIYEGDILQYKCTHKVNLATMKRLPAKGFKNVLVSFERGCFSYSIIEQYNLYYGELPSNSQAVWYLKTNKYKIIGNIYENPELLEKK